MCGCECVCLWGGHALARDEHTTHSYVHVVTERKTIYRVEKSWGAAVGVLYFVERSTMIILHPVVHTQSNTHTHTHTFLFVRCRGSQTQCPRNNKLARQNKIKTLPLCRVVFPSAMNIKDTIRDRWATSVYFCWNITITQVGLLTPDAA